MGDLNFTAYEDQSTVSTTLKIEQNGNLRAGPVLIMSRSAVQFVAHVIDEFGRSLQKSFTLLIINQVEDLMGWHWDHNDTDDDNDTFPDTVEVQYGFDPQNKNDHPRIPLFQPSIPVSFQVGNIDLVKSKQMVACRLSIRNLPS